MGADGMNYRTRRLMRGVQKIRWYHWSVYYLYRWMWDPILIGRPGMVRCMRDEFDKWLEVQDRAERKEKGDG